MELDLWRTIFLVCVVCALTVIECIAFQKKVCGEIGAYQTICEYLEKCDGSYCQAPQNW